MTLLRRVYTRKYKVFFLLCISTFIIIFIMNYKPVRVPLPNNWDYCGDLLSPTIVYSDSGKEVIAKAPSFYPEAKVLRWNDKKGWTQLHRFCEWTDTYQCLRMLTREGEVPVFINGGRDYVGRTNNNSRYLQHDLEDVLLGFLQSYNDVGLLDIGSYIGTFSIVAANQGYPVVAVEPLVENVLRFCKSVQYGRLSNLVSIFFTAISDDHRLMDVLRFPANVFAPQIVESSRFSNENNFFDTVKISTVRLDDFLPEIMLKFTKAVMYIDVDGSEYEVINGADKFFDKIDVRVILMNWSVHKISGYGLHIKNLLISMDYLPFDPYHVHIQLHKSLYFAWPDHVLWNKGSS